MRAAWFGQSQASAPSARGQHRMRRLLAQVTVASLLLVTLGLAGLPGQSPQAAQAGVPVAGDDGSGGGSPTLVSPIFTAASPPTTIDIGTALSYTFAATGTPAPTFAVSSGSLPDGLSLTADGVLAGAPTRGGKFTFSVAAANGAPPQAESSHVVEVLSPGHVEQIDTQSATVGVPFSLTAQISGYPAPRWGVD